MTRLLKATLLMLLIVSPNLCLDRIVVVRGFTVGTVHRAESIVELASGKGLNVARAARAFGIDVRVAGIVGTGPAGRSFVRQARARRVRLDPVVVKGPVRVCTLIIDPEGTETVVNEPGPIVSARASATLRTRIRAALRRAKLVVLAGSLPPGLPVELYADVISQARGIPTILDAAGDALRLGLAARPYMVKINQMELQQAMGRKLDAPDAVREAAAELRRATGPAVLVTLGARGAVLVTEEGSWQLVPPQVHRANTIGAGDSLTAGLAAGMLRGMPLLEAVRLGVGAATADVSTLLPGTVDVLLVQQLVPQVRVQPA